MANDPKLDSYLETLDIALGPITIGDRAEIITEIKSHIVEAQERDPNQSLSQILSSLGEPEAVANRYLLERGFKPGKPSKTPMIKWLTIGFLGTFAIFCITVLIIIWKFTPLISVDEKNEKVVLLGGVIDIDGKAGRFKIGSLSIHEDEENGRFDGQQTIDPKKYKEIKLIFSNGKFDLQSSLDNIMRWNCKTSGETKSVGGISEKDNIFALEMDNAGYVKCTITLPAGVKASVTGANGKLNLNNIENEFNISLSNGLINIEPASNKKYKYDLHVQNGRVVAPESSTDKDAILIKAELTNGNIEVEK